jgi:Zn-dependent oligopeptidase
MEFDALTPDGMAAAVGTAVERAGRGVAAAVAAREPTFAPVVGALSNAVVAIWDAFGRTAALATIHPDAAIREAARDADEALNKCGRRSSSVTMSGPRFGASRRPPRPGRSS